jgi:uncharacterized protein (DUF433 family)
MRLKAAQKKMVADGRIGIDPKLRFGQPQVRGVETWVIKERYCGTKETIAEISDDFGISREDVLDALEFEGMVIVRRV